MVAYAVLTASDLIEVYSNREAAEAHAARHDYYFVAEVAVHDKPQPE